MAQSIFQLVGSILVDNSAANESLAKTEEKAGGVGQKLLDGVASAGKFAAGVATAAGAGVAALTKMASESASSMDVIDKASQKMGITSDAYQEWSHVMSLSGMDISTMQTGMKTLQNQMDAAAQGTDTAITTFERLGVSIYDENGALKDQTTMLNDAVAALAEMGDGAERTALAVDLFGKSGTEMLPMLNAGSEGIEAMKQEAHDLGLVFDEDSVKAGAALNDALSNVKDSISALATGLGASLMPIVTEACNFIIDNLPTIKDIFDRLAPILVGMFETLLPQIMDLVENLLPVILSILESLMPIFSQICESVLPIVVELIGALLPILEPILKLITPLADLLLALLEPIFDLIELLLPPLVDFISVIVNAVSSKVVPAITTVTNAFKSMYSKLHDNIESIKTAFKNGFEKIVDFVKTPVNAVLGFINRLISGVCSGINTVINAMNKLKWDVPDWVPVIGGKTFGFNLNTITAPQIPLLAEGAVIEPNKPFAAVLGDQRNGTNIEAPLDTIKQAIREELNGMMLDLNIHLDPNTKKWFREISAEAKAHSKMTGSLSMM